MLEEKEENVVASFWDWGDIWSSFFFCNTVEGE